MKALSIKQPWATMILCGPKHVENRTWETNYRGRLLIHAGKNIDREAIRRFSAIYSFDELPSGILGVCDLVNVSRMVRSSWHEVGMVGFYLGNVRRFKQPIPFKGRLGIFDVPDELVAEELCQQK